MILSALIILAGCTPKDYTCEPREANAVPPPTEPPKMKREDQSGEESSEPNKPL